MGGNERSKRGWKSHLKNWEFKLAFFIIAYFVFAHVVLENTYTLSEKGLASHLKVIPEEAIDFYDQSPLQNPDRLAYMQYATNYDYLNLAILNFVQLRQANTQVPNLVILYDQILQFYASNRWSKLYEVANFHNITLRSMELIKTNYNDDSPWAASFTKLHIFNQDDFDRIVFFDSDSMFVNATLANEGDEDSSDDLPQRNGNCHIDELFKIPMEFDFALPQAYWLNNVVEGKERLKYRQKVDIPNAQRRRLRMKKLVSELPSKGWQSLPSLIYEQHKFDNVDNFFANHVMVVQPSKKLFSEIIKYVHNPFYWTLTNRRNMRKPTDYDMEVINKYLNSELHKGAINVGILPHRVYGVLTGEFGEEWHERFVVDPQYLPFIKKRSNKGWDPLSVLSSLKLVHFSDSPIPKPWEEEGGEQPYDSKRIFCKDGNMSEYEEKYPHFRPRLTDDCASVAIWAWLRTQFHRSRSNLWFAG
ncbi:uncharacterized protein LODBEIA_P01550 [Lodderomyces beijingensis]|uniref:Glucose N-acetyltransferase 1 n=1 Tax=Lodderomyces beijingensis TaxID=1775926 RepID=A0ABP0ZFH4_9ASCO